LTQPKDIWRKIVVLAVVGGLAFWAISIATSLVPITVDYRVARWSAETVWVGSLPAGLLIGFLMSFFLVRFFDKIPTKNPILKSVILSIIALVIGAILLEAPSSFGTSDVFYYFLFGTMLNVPRFLFVGIVIGYLYKRLYKGVNPAVVASKSPQVDS
jgi:hypothetical protein